MSKLKNNGNKTSEVNNKSLYEQIIEAFPPKEFIRLEQDGGFFTVTSKVRYNKGGVFQEKTIIDVFNHAYKMTFGNEGKHRDHRSGGDFRRKNGEIFANAFQGKLAECAACYYFYSIYKDKSIKPDFSVYGLNKWDSSDLSVNGLEVSIKSTKSFGNLFLLETDDWNENGVYIPNADKENQGLYDLFLLVRINPNCDSILKEKRILYSESADYGKLRNAVMEKEWSNNIVGFITRDDLINIIRNEYILPKNTVLNRKTKIDADNYYVQAGCMRDIKELKRFLIKQNSDC